VFPTVLLITTGDQVPTIPLGEVVFKVGATLPEQKAMVGEKLGVVVGLTVMVTVSEIELPQILVTVNVSTMEPEAEKGKVKLVLNPELFENKPLEADQATKF